MRGRTTCLLGLVLAATTGTMACSAPLDAPPGLELSADPAASKASTTKHAPSSVPLTRDDASVLLPSADTDGGASEGGDGPTTDAGADPAATYQARCSIYLVGDREHEGNDTLATANVLGGLACGAINSANDVDWFVVDTQLGLHFTFDPDDDAEITVRSPSGQTAASAGVSFYTSDENGRYAVQIRSSGHHTQTYLLVRN
ncbi:MAG: hypothetical protein QOI41_5120 [Myxococcales bacterium]|nr:hypothetical protein [Myxococcales bacterium]